VKVNSRVRELFDREVSMVDMFGSTTVRALARHLTGTDSSVEQVVQAQMLLSRDSGGKHASRSRQVLRQLANELVEESL